MKNRILIVLLTAALLLTGCAAGAASPVPLRKPIAAAQKPVFREQTAPAVQTQPTEPLDVITPEEAQAIALAHAAVSENQVTHIRVRFDMDDRIPEYDVEFREGFWEYEYEIHAGTGAILYWEKDD